jgi:hypothetical protein
MKRDVSTLHNVRDQRRDLFDDEEIVEEREVNLLYMK